MVSEAHGAEPAPEASPRNWSRLYEGTIGGQRVVAFFVFTVLGERPNTISGTYYYRRHASKLALVPVPGSRLLVECPEDDSAGGTPCAAPTGTWDITASENSVTGFWIGATKDARKLINLKRRQVVESDSLRRIAPGVDKAAWRQNMDAGDTYNALIAADDHLRIQDDARRYGVTWLTTRTSRYPTQTLKIVLLKSPDPEARGRINAWLKENVRPAVPCDPDEGGCDDGNDFEVQFANERFLAVAGNNYWSGGAHPSNGYSAVTFDLRTGKPITWSDILRLDEDDGHDSALDLTRTDLLAAQVLRQLQDPRYQQECLSSAVEYYRCKENRCERRPGLLKPSEWSMYPTESGLAVAIDVYDEAGRGCRGSTVIVPWTTVRKTLKHPLVLP